MTTDEMASLQPGGVFLGYIDGFAPDLLNGWAVTRAGEPCEVAVTVNDIPFATIRSDRPRPDLAQQGLSDGRGGWLTDISAAVLPGDNKVEIRFADGTHVEGSPFVAIGGAAPAGPTPDYRGELDTPIGTIIRGWAATGAGDVCEVLVSINDGPPIAATADGERPDLLTQGLSRGLGGWRLNLAGMLDGETNRIAVRFPDGRDLPNSPFEWAPGGAVADPLGRQFHGAIDSPADSDLIFGWAAGIDGEPCSVTVQLNGAEPVPVEADIPRPDLWQQDLAKSGGGWHIDLARQFRPGRNVVRVRFPDGTEMLGSPLLREISTIEDGADGYRGAIDGFDGDTIRGWATTSRGDECAVTVAVNDGAPVIALASLARPDLIAQGLAKRSGGWAISIGALLVDGANRIDLSFPDGEPLPGSPLAFERGDSAGVAAVEAEARAQGVRAMPSLAELDEISLDDLSLAIAAGKIGWTAPPEAETADSAEPDRPDNDVAEAPVRPAPPVRRPGFLARLLGRR